MGGGAGSQQDLSQTAHSCPTLWGKRVGHLCATWLHTCWEPGAGTAPGSAPAPFALTVRSTFYQILASLAQQSIYGVVESTE